MFTVPPAVALLNYIKIRELYHTSLKDQQSCDGRGVLRVKEPRGRVCAIHGRARAAKTTSKQIVPYSTHTACVLMDKYFIWGSTSFYSVLSSCYLFVDYESREIYVHTVYWKARFASSLLPSFCSWTLKNEAKTPERLMMGHIGQGPFVQGAEFIGDGQEETIGELSVRFMSAWCSLRPESAPSAV